VLESHQATWTMHSLPHILQVPWRTQVWAGAVEVGLIWLAAVQSSGRGPTLQEAAQLLAYSLLLYLVPLAAVWWQQPRDSGGVSSRAGSTLPHKFSGSKDDLASGSGPGTCCASGATNKEGAVVTSQAREVRARHRVTQVDQPAGPLQQQQAQQQQHPPLLTMSVAELASATLAPGSALYTSPLQHSGMSVKVSTDADTGLAHEGCQTTARCFDSNRTQHAHVTSGCFSPYGLNPYAHSSLAAARVLRSTALPILFRRRVSLCSSSCKLPCTLPCQAS
jgi:hypothetical protein